MVLEERNISTKNDAHHSTLHAFEKVVWLLLSKALPWEKVTHTQQYT
jgi:hypothetical protein